MGKKPNTMPGRIYDSEDPALPNLPQEATLKRNHQRGNRKYYDSKEGLAARRRVAWEPGVNIATTDVIMNGCKSSSCLVVDYDDSRYRAENVEVIPDGDSSMRRHESKASVEQLTAVLNNRPEWSKVRWVHVNGLSWEAISTIGKTYNLHRLAIEDMIDIPQRTKIDLYPHHLFGCMPLIKLVPLDGGETRMRRLNDTSHRSFTKAGYLDAHRPLTKMNMTVGQEQLSFFMLNDGVVVSFYESSGKEIEDAILERIADVDTILRSSCDSSVMLQAIIDATVDLIFPVITAYRKRLTVLEVDVLTSPTMAHTQRLHLMVGELGNLRRHIAPVTAMVSSLRGYTSSTVTPTPAHSVLEVPVPGRSVSRGSLRSLHNQPVPQLQEALKSEFAGIYFSDVLDHLQAYTEDIDDMMSTTENLIGLVFNTMSMQSNDAMQQLSLVTVIFLPLSFWTGYYGMNFKSFDDLNEDVSYYWKIAVPFSAALLLLLTWNVMTKSLGRYFKRFTKRWTEWRISRVNNRLEMQRLA